MAIYHLSAQIISSASGKSAVASAAYRHAAAMINGQTGLQVSYVNKEGVVHTELSIPAQTPKWFRARIDGRNEVAASEALWNAVERKEGVKGTGQAMEMNIALPVELTREWVETHVSGRGFVADWVMHENEGNPHIHVMIPMRPLTEKGFGPKFDFQRDQSGQVIYRADGKPRYERMAAPQKELANFRRSWAEVTNRHLALAGFDIRIDYRSNTEAGIKVEATQHIGVSGSSMFERGKVSDRVELERERKARNSQAIIDDPASILDVITREKSVFDDRDVARALFRYIDDAETFEAVRLRVGLSDRLIAVAPEVIDFETGRVAEHARWTTREMLATEYQMQAAASRLWTTRKHGVREVDLSGAFDARSFLSEEQRQAVCHVTAGEGVAAVVGFAGAGKSTMLGAANDAWTSAGYRVLGAALAGKAAEGLEKSANIPSRTLASWELAWKNGREILETGDVFVVDEAGMVSSDQLARIVAEVEQRGAKLVLVGDAMQLQPIEAGAAFRALTETIGYAELSGIRRQAHEWMREASINFARGRGADALQACRHADMVRFAPTRDVARQKLIEAWKPGFLALRQDGKRNETLILAHTNQDVFSLNQMARAALKSDGLLGDEARFVTERGERFFAPGIA